MLGETTSPNKLLTENYRLKQELEATKELLQYQSPVRDNFSTPPRRNTGHGDFSKNCETDHTPSRSVIRKLALLSPKFLVDGIQCLREITEASSLRFSDEDGDLEDTSPPPQSPEDLLSLITMRQREEMLCQLRMSSSTAKLAEPETLLAKATAIAQQAVKSWRSISGKKDKTITYF